jgi:hypothetical protein
MGINQWIIIAVFVFFVASLYSEGSSAKGFDLITMIPFLIEYKLNYDGCAPVLTIHIVTFPAN